MFPFLYQACGKLGRILTIQDDGDMQVFVDDMKFLFSPAVCEPIDDPQKLRDAPSMPDSDSEVEDDQFQSGASNSGMASLMPEVDCVPGKTVSDKNNKDKEQLSGTRIL